MLLSFRDKEVYDIFIGWLCIIGEEQVHWESLSNDLLTIRSYAQCWRN